MITIDVVTLNGQAPAQPLSADFGESGGTIGRAPENTLVLADPDRKISRTHATVSYRDGKYVLRDQGSVVPVMVNGRPLGNGKESPLAGGEEIRIAGYTMRVAGAGAAAQPAAPAAVAAPVTPRPPRPAPAHPLPRRRATPCPSRCFRGPAMRRQRPAKASAPSRSRRRRRRLRVLPRRRRLHVPGSARERGNACPCARAGRRDRRRGRHRHARRAPARAACGGGAARRRDSRRPHAAAHEPARQPAPRSHAGAASICSRRAPTPSARRAPT